MTDYDNYQGASGSEPPPPISPSSEHHLNRYPQDYSGQPRGREEGDQAYLILILGVLSLMCCFPLGIAAWIMGNRQLSKISQGRISSKNSGVIKVGRALGIIGVILGALSVILFVTAIPKLDMEEMWENFSAKPLAPEHVAYIGHWEGNKGTVIDIKASGRANFKTKSTKVEGGVVKIEGDTLTIWLGIKKEWKIRQKPTLEDSGWLMQLDDEVFRKSGPGKLASAFPS